MVHLDEPVADAEFGYNGVAVVQVCPACVPVELVDGVRMLHRRIG